MLDIKYIRENAEAVQQNAKNKGYDVSIDELLRIDTERRTLQQQADDLREKRNTIAASMKGGKPTPEAIADGKAVK
jgi:seryl-tRNA synthetase